jgi:hypothetical protein
MGSAGSDRVPITAPLHRVHWLTALALLAALWGCGGGGRTPDEASADGTAGAAGAANGGALGIVLAEPQVVSPGSDIRLAWRAPGATSFTVFVQPMAGSAFEPVDATVGQNTATFARGPAYKLDFPTARVRVRACDVQQNCTDSNAQPLQGALLAGVARFGPTGLAANSVFASRIALSADGRTLAAAAPTDRAEPQRGLGSVLMFHRASDGAWAQHARVERFDVLNNFGDPMALSGDGGTMAVGAYTESGTAGGINPPEIGSVLDAEGNVDWRGAVHVYTRDEQQQWARQAFIKASVPLPMDTFGIRIAFSHDGNLMLVGSRTRMYVFTRAGSVWRQERIFESPPGIELTPSTAIALSANGSTIAVGAVGTVQREGLEPIPYWAVYVYKRCPCGDGWRRVADLRSAKPPTTSRGYLFDGFASSLALSGEGNTLAVGAPEDPGDASDTGSGLNNGARDAGAVYVFGADADGTWHRRAFLKARSAPAFDQLGRNVALSGDGKVLVSKACGFAANADGLRRNHPAGATLGPQDSAITVCSWGGSAYVFEPDADGTWRHTAAAIAVPDVRVAFDFFSVSISADAQTLGMGTMTYTPEALGVGGAVVY